MGRKINLVLFFVIMAILSALGIYHKTSSPFGLVFTSSLVVLSLSIIGLLILSGVHLLRKHQTWQKILGIPTLFIALILIMALVLGSYDYRILLPMSPATQLSDIELNDDLNFLKSELASHPGLTPGLDSILQFDLNGFQDSVAQGTRDDFILITSRIVARFKDGHSFVPPFQVYNKSRYFPLAGHQFNDGFYILKSASEYRESINCELIAINGRSLSSINTLLGSVMGPENESNFYARLNQYLFASNLLFSLKIIDSANKAFFTFRNRSGQIREIEVRSVPFPNWAFWNFKPIQDRRPVLNNLRKPNFRWHVTDRLLQLEINLIEPTPDTNFKVLANQIDSVLSNNLCDLLVIDLRNNTGGNNTLFKPLIQVLQRHDFINQDDRLFFFTSRTTFSAGINFLDALRQGTNGTVIGKVPGAGANHFGDARTVRLPHSGVFFFLSTKEWHSLDPTTSGNHIKPDIAVRYTFEDYTAKRDPWFEAIP